MRSTRTLPWPALLYGLALAAVLSGALAGVVYHYRTPLSVRAVTESVRDRLRAQEVRYTSASGDLLRGLSIRGISAVVPADEAKWNVSIGELRVRLTLWPMDRLDWSAQQVTLDASSGEISGAAVDQVSPDAGGYVLEGVQVTGVARLAGGDARCMRLRYDPSGKTQIEGVSGTTGAGTLFQARKAVADAARITVEDARIEGLPFLKTAHTLEAQSVEWDLAQGRYGLRQVINARLRIAGSEDPIVIIGAGSPEGPDVRVYSRSVEVEALKAALGAPADLKLRDGAIDDIELHVTGAWKRPHLTGILTLDRVRYGRFEFAGVRVWSDGLDAASTRTGPEVYGPVVASGGQVRHPRGIVDLLTAKAAYYGDPAQPEMDIEGTTRIGSADVRIYINGTPRKPQVRLGSDAPFSQEKLLLMLATGREWPATEKALEAGKATLDVTREFLDYFVLGGTGQKMKERFGLRDLTLGLSDQVTVLGIEKIIPFAGGTRVGVEGRSARTDEAAPAQKSVAVKASGQF